MASIFRRAFPWQDAVRLAAIAAHHANIERPGLLMDDAESGIALPVLG
jgi:hypothetical protein